MAVPFPCRATEYSIENLDLRLEDRKSSPDFFCYVLRPSQKICVVHVTA